MHNIFLQNIINNDKNTHQFPKRDCVTVNTSEKSQIEWMQYLRAWFIMAVVFEQNADPKVIGGRHDRRRIFGVYYGLYP